MTRLTVHAKPRAKVSRIVRITGLTVEVAIAAVPAGGAANAELIAVLAKALGVPKRDLSLVRGASSKHKAVEVAGLTEAEISDNGGALAPRGSLTRPLPPPPSAGSLRSRHR